MPPDDLKPNFQVTGHKQWVNWHENFKPQPLKKLIDVWNVRPEESRIEWYNAATKGFQEVIADALRRGDSMRAIGGGWSFSDVTRTDGILLNTRPLNYRFRIDHNQAHPGYGGDASNLAFVQCGISIADLNRYLRNKGKSLKTSGASNGQTIVGAFSTGTHGSALDVGSIQDYVVALHLIVAPERAVWLERASQPVIADTFPSMLGAELIRDDDLFNAALVSFGCFGIIHGVVIEATDLYYLQAYRRLMPLNLNYSRK
ncbi:FAD-binding protein [candidate division KSB1 bacterium]|nr:FAD-binding protein [candidate division KSB1 bacterium]